MLDVQKTRARVSQITGLFRETECSQRGDYDSIVLLCRTKSQAFLNVWTT